MNKLDAYKMDGLGNDFIIFDKRTNPISLNKKQLIQISNRNNIGCDQVIFIDNDKVNDAYLTFYNSNGEEVSACGNGTRCVAFLLMKKNDNKNISLKTKAGVLKTTIDNNNLVTVNMGQPIFNWEKIPLSQKIDNTNLKIKIKNIDNQEMVGGFSLSIGNPHIIFFVSDLSKFNIEKIGPKLENHHYFPEKCNVTLAKILNKRNIKVKVWERGAGLTKACGTAACATAVSAAFLKYTERLVDIEFEKGLLNINWKSDNNIYMSGAVSKIKKIKINI